MYEKEWRDNITATLGYIPGVLVTTNVELDPEIEHVETQTNYDPKAVPYNTRETSGNKLVRGVAPAGRPGLAAQSVNQQPPIVGSSGGSGKQPGRMLSLKTQSAVPSNCGSPCLAPGTDA